MDHSHNPLSNVRTLRSHVQRTYYIKLLSEIYERKTGAAYADVDEGNGMVEIAGRELAIRFVVVN